jgi:predicted dehydrogenase
MLKVGIIGCGKIADQHAEVIVDPRRGEIVGVCDEKL